MSTGSSMNALSEVRNATKSPMNRGRLPFVIAMLSLALGGCSASSFPTSAEQALQESASFELLSLSPDPDTGSAADEDFHGWKVLGSTTIRDADTRAELIARFKSGVDENDGTVAECFNPRHGIRVVHDQQVHEFVICFECYQVKWFIDGEEREGFLISPSPQPTFDEVLREADIPLPDAAGA